MILDFFGVLICAVAAHFISFFFFLNKPNTKTTVLNSNK